MKLGEGFNHILNHVKIISKIVPVIRRMILSLGVLALTSADDEVSLLPGSRLHLWPDRRENPWSSSLLQLKRNKIIITVEFMQEIDIAIVHLGGGMV